MEIVAVLKKKTQRRKGAKTQRIGDLPQKSWLFGFSPEGWHIQLGNDRLWLIKSCVSALRASRTLLCTWLPGPSTPAEDIPALRA